MINTPRARIRSASPAIRWFFEPASALAGPERSFLLGQLFNSPIAAIMGSVCALLVMAVAFFRSGNATYLVLAVAELTLMLSRLADWVRRVRRLSLDPDGVLEIDTSVTLSVLWCALQGTLAFVITSSGDLVLSVIAATLVMATVGPICARNYSAPRFAFVLVLLCVIPFVIGVVASGEPWLVVIVAITPPFLLGAMQIMNSFHKSMLLTLTMHAKALHLSEHDALTGILNRQGMDQALNRILPNMDDQMALISIDLDGFKKVNDNHGHGAGDMLLIRTAARLKEQLRDEDLLARMGGDEFMAVVRGMTPEDIGPLADRLIAAISRHAHDLGEGISVRVGASVGFACLPEDAAGTVELRLRADQALYAAKGAGKGVGRRYGALAALAPPISTEPRSLGGTTA